MKKLLALLLILSLFSAPTIMARASAEEEPVHIIMSDPYYGDASSEEGYKMVQDYILEQTGILLDSYRFDSSTKKEKLALLLSSGEQLNLFWGYWTDYYQYGLITPMTPYLDGLTNAIDRWEPYEGFNTVTTADGTVWGVPRICNRTFYQSFIRKDYMDMLGLAYPTNFEDYEDVLYALKEADPYGNGETIPLITRGDSMKTLEYHYLAAFTPAGRSNWWDEEDDSLKPYYLQDGYYDFLVKMHQWYVDGIIHPENYTWSLAEVRSYLASGRVAASGAYSTDLTNQYATMKKNVPDSEWWYAENGMDAANGNKCETLIAGNDECAMLHAGNTQEENEAIIRLINWAYSSWYNNKVLNSGIEGVHWEYDTTYENCYEDNITKLIDNDVPYKGDFWITIGLPMEADCVSYDDDGLQNYHNYMLRHQKDFFTCKLPYDLNVIYDDAKLFENVLTASDINTMVSEQTMKFFIGEIELNEKNWEKFINDLYSIGMQDYIDEYTSQYKTWYGLE